MLLVIMVAYVSITKDNFFSFNNMKGIALNCAPRFIIAFGVPRLSDHPRNRPFRRTLRGLSACIAGTLLQDPNFAGRFWPNLPDLPVVLVLLICVAVCCIFGLINGMVISFLSVPAFIGTLGMQLIVYGVVQVYTKNVRWAAPQGFCQRRYRRPV